MEKVYACIDLKSFYASVECVKRKLDPLKTNLVVADKSRTEKTICLAVSPSLKKYGIPGRARLFEVISKVKEINNQRKKNNNYKPFKGKSFNEEELEDKTKELEFIIAPPHMKDYLNISAKIYNTYLKYISSEDIYVYSIDEAFFDLTNYLKYYNLTPKKLVTKMIKDVYDNTGITATGGIGTNLFLAKVAMDVLAKHEEADEYGVRIAALNEMDYRYKMWNHKPITDIWRVGKGIAEKLEKYKIYTMGDIALCSVQNEELLYKLFGVNAELLIDHAWGYEPCTLKDIKNYKPSSQSLSTGQVLQCPYDYNQTKLIIREMAENLSLNLVSKKLVTDKLTLTLGYDIKSQNTSNYEIDYYGRKIPKHSHGTITLDHKTSSAKIIMDASIKLYDKIVNKNMLVKRLNICAVNVSSEKVKNTKENYKQFNLFSSLKDQNNELNLELKDEQNERKLQNVMLNIKQKFGKNSILRGMNLEEGGTMIERNRQIGGHHE